MERPVDLIPGKHRVLLTARALLIGLVTLFTMLALLGTIIVFSAR